MPFALSHTSASFILPDLVTLSSPLPIALNPHYSAASAASRAWILSHADSNALPGLSPARMKAVFAAGDFERLAARCFPYADAERFRALCDFVHLLFVVDEVSDGQDAEGAEATGRSVLDALTDPTLDDGSELAAIAVEFRSRLDGIGERAFTRFIHHFGIYVDHVVKEAAHRELRHVLDVESYQKLRRGTSGCCPYYALIEFALGIDLPDEIYLDRTFSAFYWSSVDMACIANDVYSFATEKAAGLAGHNIVTVLMRSQHLTLQGASDATGSQYAKLMDTYMTTRAQLLQQTGQPDVDAFVRAMDYWPVGNVVWSLETGRYFGTSETEREKVRKTRVVRLCAKRMTAGDESDGTQASFGV